MPQKPKNKDVCNAAAKKGELALEMVHGDERKLRFGRNDRPGLGNGKMSRVTETMLKTLTAMLFVLCFAMPCMGASIYCAWWWSAPE